VHVHTGGLGGGGGGHGGGGGGGVGEGGGGEGGGGEGGGLVARTVVLSAASSSVLSGAAGAILTRLGVPLGSGQNFTP
jgi:hypothetical protein